MILPSRNGVWTAIESLDDVDVRRVTRDGVDLVEVIDKRTWTELVSLTSADATVFATRVVTAAGQPVEIRVDSDPDGWLSGTMFGPVELPPPVEVDDRAP